MSILKFELKKDHLNLLKHINWSEMDETNVIRTIDSPSPFGGDDIYEDMGLILYGLPEGFNPLEDVEIEYTDEQKQEMDKLLNELPMAIEVILNSNTFELGSYKTKWHYRDWKKLNK